MLLVIGYLYAAEVALNDVVHTGPLVCGVDGGVLVVVVARRFYIELCILINAVFLSCCLLFIFSVVHCSMWNLLTMF